MSPGESMSASELAETLRRCSTLSAEESAELVDRLFAVLGRPSGALPAPPTNRAAQG